MSGADVLAVLDDLIADMGDTPGTTGHQVAQVRDAVAELIGAANEVADTTPEAQREKWSCHARITTAANCGRCSRELRLAAALANVTGGGEA